MGPVEVPLPEYQTEGSAGLDLCAALTEPVTLAPGQRRAIPTGLRVAVPSGYEGQVRARSGLARDHGIAMVNGVGTLDNDFRGELCALVINLGQEPFVIEPLMRIAQLVISPVERVRVNLAPLDDTARGRGGFGSTGV